MRRRAGGNLSLFRDLKPVFWWNNDRHCWRAGVPSLCPVVLYAVGANGTASMYVAMSLSRDAFFLADIYPMGIVLILFLEIGVI